MLFIINRSHLKTLGFFLCECYFFSLISSILAIIIKTKCSQKLCKRASCSICFSFIMRSFSFLLGIFCDSKYSISCFLSGLISQHDYVSMQWTFHPFIYHSKRFYTVLIWRRVLAFLVVSSDASFFIYNILLRMP